jgi:hypothetical protein
MQIIWVLFICLLTIPVNVRQKLKDDLFFALDFSLCMQEIKVTNTVS